MRFLTKIGRFAFLRPPFGDLGATILLLRKTRINVFSYGIKIWTDLSSVLSGITRVTDIRTDGRTDRQNSPRYTASALHAAR